MPLRVRIALLAILAAAWFVLSAASFAHGKPVVGLFYFVCGGVLTVMARKSAHQRRR